MERPVLAARIVGALMLCMVASDAVTHELQANRLTLVLREHNHLSLTFYIDYAGALHRALAPGRTFQEFVLTYSAMRPQDFQAEVQRVQKRFQNETKLTLASGTVVPVTRWNWPDIGRVQAALQERAMRSIVAPGDHTHDEPLEIHAEAISSGDLRSFTIRLPEEFQRVLVVSYRPSQVWADPALPPAPVAF
jgi:hypothetical protein